MINRLLSLAVLLIIGWIVAHSPEYLWKAIVWSICVLSASMFVAAVVKLFRGG